MLGRYELCRSCYVFNCNPCGCGQTGHHYSEKEKEYHAGLDQALQTGYWVLEQGGTALDAVERSVIALEDNPLFNAGRGSVLTSGGTHEMDAAMICGNTLQAGAVVAMDLQAVD